MNNTIQTLNSILEALMTINVKGNDTITMSNCLQALDRAIKEIQASATRPVVEDPDDEE